MKTSTRILNMILVFVLLFGCVPFGVTAEADHGAVISDAVERYYERSDIYMEHGFFSEKEFPGLAFLYNYLTHSNRGLFGEYCTTTKVDGLNKYTYEIPASVFDEMVFEIFADTETAVSALKSVKEYMTDKDTPYYAFDGVDMIIESSERHMLKYAGYREREDGLFESWSYIADDLWMTNYGTGEEYEYFRYTPDEDDVEGVDYLILPVSAFDFSQETHYGVGFVYVPSEIFCAVKSVIEIGDDGVRLHSFEKEDKSLVPDDLREYIVPDGNRMHYVTMYTDKNSFGEGVEVYEQSPSGGGILTDVQIVMRDVEKAFTAHKFTAVKDGEEVDPVSPVTVAFDIPDRFMTDVRLYKVYERGSDVPYELVEAVVDADARTVTAVIDDFDCIYAVGGEYDGSVNWGDATSDGKLNLGDVSLMLKYIAKWSGIEIDLVAADVTRDGRVNINDAAKMLKYIAKWDYVYIAPAQ